MSSCGLLDDATVICLVVHRTRVLDALHVPLGLLLKRDVAIGIEECCRCDTLDNLCLTGLLCMALDISRI